ncbi:MAG: hypothetical protein IPH04_14105 [Saprospirales bacterium]|nr:hypothetical protein [Saprospirales bacterium]
MDLLFTDRYENSAASRAFADYIAIKNVLTGVIKKDGIAFSEADIPILNRENFPLSTAEELMTVGWPMQENIRGRGILAVANYFGAIDFADDSAISPENIQTRQYHHVFPDALLKEAKEYFPDKITNYLSLNCALITDRTNRNIGRKDPLTYLKERYAWTDEGTIEKRLNSHLIPMAELSAGSYEGLSDENKAIKIKKDYEEFLGKRSRLISAAVRKLAEGVDVSAMEVINSLNGEDS